MTYTEAEIERAAQILAKFLAPKMWSRWLAVRLCKAAILCHLDERPDIERALKQAKGIIDG